MSQTLQTAARTYLFTHGRPLDQARYVFFFEGGSAQSVLDVLHGNYQNDDGGFGQALEPDIRTPASSVIATTHAFEIFHEVGASADDPALRAGVDYLLRSVEMPAQVWPMVPPAVEDAPHAPWWTYADTRTNFDGFGINPTAAVVAHLLNYAALVPDRTWLEQCAAAVVARIAAKAGGLDLNEMHTVLTLHAASGLPDTLRAPLDAALTAAIPAAVAADPAQWSGYTLQPLEVASTPQAFAAQLLAPELMQRNLAYWTETQLPDGSWPLPWQWDFVDAAAWAQAERDWKGVHIVQRLRTLAAWGAL